MTIHTSKLRYFSTYLLPDFWEGPEGVQHFSFHDLSTATNDFDSTYEIGSGGFGKVFVGVVNGRRVAIKRAHPSAIQSSSGFRNEVMLLSRLHHRHLVHLLGFCEEEGIQVLFPSLYLKISHLNSTLTCISARNCIVLLILNPAPIFICRFLFMNTCRMGTFILYYLVCPYLMLILDLIRRIDTQNIHMLFFFPFSRRYKHN